MSDFIPQDILMCLLVKLPVKSLIRFRCVSRSWYSLISDPNFLSMHIKSQNNYLFLRHYADFYRQNHCSLHFNDTLDEYMPLESPNESSGKFFNILGSFNGLICLSSDGIVSLWNPSIRKYVTLPKPNINSKKHYQYCRSTFGFGYDSLANDYKIVSIEYFEDRYYKLINQPQVDLFELSKRSWRRISTIVPPHKICNHSSSTTYMNGVVHWIALDQTLVDNHRYLIVSFNMSNEEFGVVKMPESVDAASDYIVCKLSILAVKESLWLFHEVREDQNYRYCIWVMQEYGVMESWTKQFTIYLQAGIYDMLSRVIKDGDEILVVTYDGKLLSYDPEKEEIKSLGSHGIYISCYMDKRSFHLDTYVESLVLLDEANAILGEDDVVTCRRSPTLFEKFTQCINFSNNIE